MRMPLRCPACKATDLTICFCSTDAITAAWEARKFPPVTLLGRLRVWIFELLGCAL